MTETRTKTGTATPTLTQGRTRYAIASLRILMGWTFLWAFLDKTFGLGFATESANAWIRGGSPTYGFLTFGSSGPFAETFQALAGNVFVDWLFMLGLLGVGISFILGIGMRLGAAAGVAMLLLMYFAAPPTNNPLVDDHIVYAVVLVLLPLVEAGRTWGLAERWAKLGLVERAPILA